jgi:hypothetical protein
MTTNRRRMICAVLCTSLCASAGAKAQDERAYETAHVVSGKPAQIGLFARANPTGCNAGSFPDIKMVHVPEHGVLTIKRETVKTDRYPQCPGLQLQAQALFYQSRENYVGQDSIAFIMTLDNGEQQAREITIDVTAAP